MKSLNLISLTQAYENINNVTYAKYLKYLDIKPKSHEVDDLKSLIDELLDVGDNLYLYDCYYFGYVIPQIGKEFDLLRFGKDSIINIELKRTSDEEKIKKQLVQNLYYLSFLNKEVHNYSYISSTNKLYYLKDGKNLIEVKFQDLYESINNQHLQILDNVDNLFNPSNYLVSPFNSTKKFLSNQYFLTIQQELVKKQVLSEINSSGTTFISILGNAGTGKSLLTYDIAKKYITDKKKVLIIHCGQSNNGHDKLNEVDGWDVIPIKELNTEAFKKYFLIVIDETQRIYPTQLEKIITKIKTLSGNCLFSYDKQQCLRSWEVNNDIDTKINLLTLAKKHELTDKIRTNKEIASFIRCLFDKSSAIHAYERKNVVLNYFSNYKQAKEYMTLLHPEWKIINYTPANAKYPYDNLRITGEASTHAVIGQEFDNVVAVIDKYFYYKGNELSTKGYMYQPYYHPAKMLFQIMTRTRKKLNLIIIDNDEIMERCLNMLE